MSPPPDPLPGPLPEPRRKGPLRRLAPEMALALALGLLGAFLLWHARGYPMGTIVRVGPGVFPFAVGSGLMLLSVLLCLEALRRAEPVALPPPAAFVLIMAGLGAWALMVERVGFVPATLTLVVLASLASRPVRPFQVLALGLGLAGFGYVVFLHLLGIPLTPFGRW